MFSIAAQIYDLLAILCSLFCLVVIVMFKSNLIRKIGYKIYLYNLCVQMQIT